MKSQFSGADKYFGHIFHNEVLFLVLFLRRDGTTGREAQHGATGHAAMERAKRKAKAALLPTSTA
jgi:hypothetical protein